MTEETEHQEQADDLPMGGSVNPAASLETIQETMKSFLAAADVNSVYQKPVEHGDTIIIPAAEVVAVMGFGVGHGEGADEEGSSGGGGGGGGGGKVFSRPVAVVVASPEGVRVDPVFDMTKIALGFLTTFAFMFGMLARLRKPKKALEDLQNGSWG